MYDSTGTQYIPATQGKNSKTGTKLSGFSDIFTLSITTDGGFT